MNPVETAVEAAAAAMWNRSSAVAAGVRPRWEVASQDPGWAKPVRHTREEAAAAVEAARRTLVAHALTETAAHLEIGSPVGRHQEYVKANREDVYLLRARASEYLEGAR